MTIEALYSLVLQNQRGILFALPAVPLIVFAFSFVHGVYDGREAPWRHVYASVVHFMSAIFAAVVALFVYHILDSGSLGVPTEALPLTGAFFGMWLLLLIVVKRAVDFSLIRSVRNPLLLLFTWFISWTGAWFVDAYNLLPIPVSRSLLLATLGIGIFLVLRILGLLFSRLRS